MKPPIIIFVIVITAFLLLLFYCGIFWEFKGVIKAGYIEFNGSLLKIGGIKLFSKQNGEVPSSGGFSYTPKYEYKSGYNGSVSWSGDGTNWKDSSEPWANREGFSLQIFNDRLYLSGGFAKDETRDSGFFQYMYSHPDVYYSDVYSSDDGKKWTKITQEAGWEPRTGHSMAAFKNKLWILGGKGTNGVLNDIWSSADGKKWELALKKAPWSPRYSENQDYQFCIVFQDKLLVFGGYKDDAHNSPDFSEYYGWDYDNRGVWQSEDGMNWKLINDTVFDKMEILKIIEYNKKLLVFSKDELWSSGDGINWILQGRALGHAGDTNQLYDLSKIIPHCVFKGKLINPDTQYESSDGIKWKNAENEIDLAKIPSNQ